MSQSLSSCKNRRGQLVHIYQAGELSELAVEGALGRAIECKQERRTKHESIHALHQRDQRQRGAGNVAAISCRTTAPRRKAVATKVLVSQTPVVTCYSAPTQRVLFSPMRDANPFFHLMEALWMLAGRDDVASRPASTAPSASSAMTANASGAPTAPVAEVVRLRPA
jgi:hypothetical protein